MSLIKHKLISARHGILSIEMIQNLLGRLWWLIPNSLRLRLPITAIGYGFIFPLKPIKWVLDPRELISRKYFSYGFRGYERLTQKYLFKEIEFLSRTKKVNFMNIGANTGLYALLVGKKFPKTKIILFEPVPLNVKFLRKNMELNNLTPEIYEMAAGNSNGFAHIYTNQEFLGMASFNENNSLSTKVKIVRLDETIKNEIHVVLIDVEGHELEVLKGMNKILRDFGPSLIIETNIELIDKVSIFLKTYGYGPPLWLGKNKKFGPQEKNFLFRRFFQT